MRSLPGLVSRGHSNAEEERGKATDARARAKQEATTQNDATHRKNEEEKEGAQRE